MDILSRISKWNPRHSDLPHKNTFTAMAATLFILPECDYSMEITGGVSHINHY